jgi:hypothetical protein
MVPGRLSIAGLGKCCDLKPPADIIGEGPRYWGEVEYDIGEFAV